MEWIWNSESAKLSKIFNAEWEEYKHGGMTQEKLGKAYGFHTDSIARILPIHSQLTKFSVHVQNFSNRDLSNLARIKHDLFREAVIQYAKEKEKTLKTKLLIFQWLLKSHQSGL